MASSTAGVLLDGPSVQIMEVFLIGNLLGGT
jgi:hypothetical protein